MGLDYNSARIFALTLGRRAIDDIRRDGLRQLRNYVDMCAFLAKHPLAQRFFEYAQTALEQPDPPYFAMAQRLIDTVSENTLCTIGVNFGFGSMLYGSEKLAEYARRGEMVSWITFSTGEDPGLAADVEGGETMGSFLWSLYLKEPVSSALIELIEEHPQSIFQLVMEPECFTPSAVGKLSGMPNVMTAVCIRRPVMTPETIEAFRLLNAHHMLQAAFLWVDAAWGDRALEDAWLQELARYTTVCICSRKAGMDAETSDALRRQIWGCRLRAEDRLFLIDLQSDVNAISSHMPMQIPARVSSAVTPEIPLYL